MRLRPRLHFPLVIGFLAVAYFPVHHFWHKYIWHDSRHPNALWHIISQKCLPDQEKNGQPAPCSQVNEKQGFVVLKDMEGPLQYLLMPTERITGIESPALLEDRTPNFFAQAWQARHFMADKYGKPIDDSNISLAINSQFGRSQNQMHIHISCLLPKVKTQLSDEAGQIGYRWQELPEKLKGHTYLARKVSPAELSEKGAFRLLADGVPEARQKMGHYGLAMVSLKGGDFLLLANKRSLLGLNDASTEEIQDHKCTVLDPIPPYEKNPPINVQ
ncbi:CDP-diacylglycerol diphosphatase [Rouxiella sp. WC2420]|uniref:CDP-diacylglycerol pyrophosphatase n=1 Tax=Rouxiella sp. WC2420 TaxID=3234145 RepID=A0AB39VQN7_9GAMM